MDRDGFKRATKRGAAVGALLFVVFGIPLTLLYGAYGGYRFFARLGMDYNSELWGKIGWFIGGAIGTMAFFCIFIAFCASMAGAAYYLKHRSGQKGREE
ncbi:MAG: hypothetical protein HRF49_12150 [bacterium]|jgi:integral membrane sensor domain MASE1